VLIEKPDEPDEPVGAGHRVFLVSLSGFTLVGSGPEYLNNPGHRRDQCRKSLAPLAALS
jgi:hypothetical protein